MHPNGQVLSIAGSEYVRYRLKDKDLVIGVLAGKDRKAYSLDRKIWSTKQKNTWNLVQDVISETPVVVYHNPDQYATGVWKRTLTDGKVLELAKVTDGHYAKDAEGGEWNLLTGKGPGDQQLESLPHMNIYWFAWADFYPETELHPSVP